MKVRNGWSITFQKNVHMYCHRIGVAKGNLQYDVPCEDTPEGFVGVWLYEIGLDEPVLQNLLACIVEWANSAGFRYRIYTARDSYVTNESSARGDA